MPKSDLVRRIDQKLPSGPASTPAGAAYSASGLADKLDGYDASPAGLPNTIPVLDASGRLPPWVLPDSALAPEQITGATGAWYIAPTLWVIHPLGETDTSIVVSEQNMLAVGDRVLLSYQTRPTETVAILGGPEAVGAYWRYLVQRGPSPGRFPAYTRAFNLGSTDDGGYIVLRSGDRAAETNDAPFIAMRTFTNGVETERLRIGRLNDLPAAFKAAFPDVPDAEWNTFSLAADHGFFRGVLHAIGGDIEGDLTVHGQFAVLSTSTNARFEIGRTVSGWGQTLRNRKGEPVWGVVLPYAEDNAEGTDVAWFVISQGQRAIDFRWDDTLHDWRLRIGGFTITESAFTNDDFQIDVARKRLRLHNTTLAYDLSIGHAGLNLILFANEWFAIAADPLEEMTSHPFLVDRTGYVKARQFAAADNDFGLYRDGASGSFTSADNKQVVVTGGLITGII